MFNDLINLIKDQYKGQDFIPLHAPTFAGNEKKYVLDTIDSTFVSSVGQYVVDFEEQFAAQHGCKYGIATSNGTAALHLCLVLAGVTRGDLVITQSLTFIATCNALAYCGADPVFLDVDKSSLGLSPNALNDFISNKCRTDESGQLVEIESGRPIKAVVPMHTFGHPCKIDEIASICKEHSLILVEDAAEAVGTSYKGQPLGSYGDVAAFSFNGNKTITTGGGGIITTNNPELAAKAKHLSTTAKISHAWHFDHDQIGYNYRMPNLNAALGLAQLEQLEGFITKKRALANKYKTACESMGISFVNEPEQAKSNYWLNAVLFKDATERDEFLKISNEQGMQTRPIWRPMHLLPMFDHCTTDSLKNTSSIFDRLVNIPSGIAEEHTS